MAFIVSVRIAVVRPCLQGWFQCPVSWFHALKSHSPCRPGDRDLPAGAWRRWQLILPVICVCSWQIISVVRLLSSRAVRRSNHLLTGRMHLCAVRSRRARRHHAWHPIDRSLLLLSTGCRQSCVACMHRGMPLSPHPVGRPTFPHDSDACLRRQMTSGRSRVTAIQRAGSAAAGTIIDSVSGSCCPS